MQTNKNNSERGQAIVLIVLAIIALLGFTALAVDGSLVYSDRRWAQNAADASALAGAGAAAQYLEDQHYTYGMSLSWVGNSGTSNACVGVSRSAGVQGIAAAIARATENDYNLQHAPDPLAEPFGGVKVECVIESGVPYLDVTVVVKETTDTAFAQVVFPGGLENTVTAVARVRAPNGGGNGNAIVALDPRACRGGGTYYGLKLNGLHNEGLKIEDGGMWSNGCLDGPGNPDVRVYDGGSVDYFDPGSALTPSDIEFPDGGALGAPHTDPPFSRMTALAYTAPYANIERLCSSTSYTHYSPGDDAPRPGRDTGILYDSDGDGIIELAAGLYCVRASQNDRQIDISNNSMRIEGDGVTILLMDVTLSITGGEMVLTAVDNFGNPTPHGDAYPGLLFYAPTTNPRCGNGCMTLNGNSGTTFTGTILAPAGEVIFNGSNGAKIEGQIIAYDVDIGGSADSYVRYNPDVVLRIPPYLNMQK